MGRGGEGWGGEGANKVLQPAQYVRLRASIISYNTLSVPIKTE